MAQERHFGGRVHAAAMAMGLETPVQLAKACKVSRQTAAHWLTLTGPEISVRHLLALRRALNVRLGWLAEGEGSVARSSSRDADVQRAVAILGLLPAKVGQQWLKEGERLARAK